MFTTIVLVLITAYLATKLRKKVLEPALERAHDHFATRSAVRKQLKIINNM